MKKINKKICYRVSNKKTKKVFAKCTSKKNATRQMRLLRAIENNNNFIPNGRVRNTLKKR
jgi:hypothetical protein